MTADGSGVTADGSGVTADRAGVRLIDRLLAVPLRRSLLLSAVGLATLAMVVSGVVGTLALRSYLLSRTDDQLRTAAALAAQRATTLARAASGEGPQAGEALRSAIAPSEFAVEFAREGEVLRFSGAADLPLGALTRAVPPTEEIDTPGPPRTVLGYRAVAVRTPGGDIVVALPLQPVRDTVERLVRVELVVGVLVLALLAGLTRILLGLQLRPLEEVTATATEIAEGRLDRRVPTRSPGPRPRSEVALLTAAVNGMLGRIQTALTAEQRSAERLRAFVADASHELRTPLTSIRGYVHLLRAGMVPPDDRGDALRRVDDEAARMAALVDDLLALARWDAPRDRRLAEVDLVPILRDSLADALATQPGRPARLEVPQRCLVRGDAAGLRQVVANLLGNVRAHTPPGTAVTVRLTTEGGRAVVEVMDDGPGMPVEIAARALERFVRGGVPAPGQAPGSGLGLAIVDEIVAAHEGSVSVRSAPGEGTAVRVELPLVEPTTDS